MWMVQEVLVQGSGGIGGLLLLFSLSRLTHELQPTRHLSCHLEHRSVSPILPKPSSLFPPVSFASQSFLVKSFRYELAL